MKHIIGVTQSGAPAKATTLLEMAQKGAIFNTFASALNTTAQALANWINIGPDDDLAKTA